MLDRGRVAQFGSHSELIDQPNSLYYAMWSRQQHQQDVVDANAGHDTAGASEAEHTEDEGRGGGGYGGGGGGGGGHEEEDSHDEAGVEADGEEAAGPSSRGAAFGKAGGKGGGGKGFAAKGGLLSAGSSSLPPRGPSRSSSITQRTPPPATRQQQQQQQRQPLLREPSNDVGDGESEVDSPGIGFWRNDSVENLNRCESLRHPVLFLSISQSVCPFAH